MHIPKKYIISLYSKRKDIFMLSKARSGKIYVSFSGEAGAKINTVHSFNSSDGSYVGPVFESSDSYRELRNMAEIRNGGGEAVLCVVNSYKKNSTILRFGEADGTGGLRRFLGPLPLGTSRLEMPLGEWNSPHYTAATGIIHPYDLAFTPDAKSLFVSCQDTNAVFCLGSLEEQGKHNEQQQPFVPAFSAVRLVNTPVRPEDGGLTARGAHSVRGIAIFPNYGITSPPQLYLAVADQAADRVIFYNEKGEFQPQETIENIKSPTQLRWHGGILHITSPKASCVNRFDPVTKQLSVFIEPDRARLEAISGIAFDLQGNCFVGDRKTKAVYLYGSDGKLVDENGPFIDLRRAGLDDCPEGLLWIEDV